MPSEGVRDPEWVKPLCQIASTFRSGDASIRELFQRAAPDVDDPQFVKMVGAQLAGEPGLVESWQQYSYDKRGSPSPYLDGTEVGFLEVTDGGVRRRGVAHFDSAAEACSSFIFREAVWVLERREVV